jgi:hypothetical protein
MEGGGFGDALYGQAYNPAEQQIPYNLQDPRYQSQGGHYMTPPWQNPTQGHKW